MTWSKFTIWFMNVESPPWFPLCFCVSLPSRRELGGMLPGCCVLSAVSQPKSSSCSVNPRRLEASELPSFPYKILTHQVTGIRLSSNMVPSGLKAKAQFLSLPALMCNILSGIWDPHTDVLEENSIRTLCCRGLNLGRTLTWKYIFNSSSNGKYFCLPRQTENLKLSENRACLLRSPLRTETKRKTGRANRYRNTWKESGQSSMPTSAPTHPHLLSAPANINSIFRLIKRQHLLLLPLLGVY